MKRISSGVTIALLIAFSSAAFAWDHDHDWRRFGPLVWVDKNGKTIGRAVGDARVQVKVDRLELVLPLGFVQVCSAPNTACRFTLDVTWGAGVAPVRFTQQDCGGVAYVTFLAAGSARAVGIAGPKLYIGEDSPSTPSGSPVLPPPLSYLSILSGDGSCFNTTGPLWPAWRVETTLGLGTLRFTPPFRLR
jgi:hypothetical protein